MLTNRPQGKEAVRVITVNPCAAIVLVQFVNFIRKYFDRRRGRHCAVIRC